MDRGSACHVLEVFSAALHGFWEGVVFWELDSGNILRRDKIKERSQAFFTILTTKTKYVPSGRLYFNPALSNADSRTSRLSSYSAICFSKNPRDPACSSPHAAASCKGELEQNTMRVQAARVGLMIDSGPISQPTRQPVAANASGEEYMSVNGVER